MKNGWCKSSLIVCLASTVLLLGACAQQATLQGAGSGEKPNFTGSWEMDYQSSDRINDKIRALYREINRQEQKRAAANDMNRNRQGAGLVIGGSSGNGVINLARLAELITKPQLLEIEQDTARISISREESFALFCSFAADRVHAVSDAHGKEVCGWDAHQLVFQIYLPDGLSIYHRLTLAPDGEKLNVATTVSSDSVRYPFTLNRVYQRFEPFDDGIDCEMTLTRGRVCSTVSSRS